MRINNNHHKNYWVSLPFINKFFQKILKKNREIFYNYFKNSIFIDINKNILDVGTTDIVNEYENIFLQKYPYKEKITCLSNQELLEVKKKYPEIQTLLGDARNMNFEDNCFEIVHSNATIEHVGNFENQIKFIQECYRVSSKYVFIQTPNKLFPIDFHTKIPLIHFLPDKVYRTLLKLVGLSFYSDINNLNLLSKKKLIVIMKILNIYNYKIIDHKLFGLRSNIVLIIRK
jgi:ubiquinone/menaquinone biosynthesis C-methylase UbiE|tara:strand:+ start:7347 stop:8036 length:690 start_codon:yes stop_codon:yes gene_type:complete